jgi:type I restriction enzyme, S subunit
MSALAPGWTLTTLGEIADTRLGKMLSKEAKKGRGARPYLRNKNVQWSRIDIDDLLEMDFEDDELDRFRVLPGDLLVCEGGDVGRAAIWRGQIDWIGYQKALHRVRPLAGIAPEYLLYGFMWLGQTRAFDRHVTGSTIKHLPQEDLRLLSIPLPPLNEQRRIVAAIEEHLSRLDAADACLVAARRRFDQLPSILLSAALSPVDRQARLADVAEVRLGRQRSPKNHSGTNMRPYLRAANVTWKGLDLADVKSMNFSPAEVPTYELVDGDVLLSEASGSASEVGKPAVWRGEIEGCCFQNTLIRVRSQRAVPDFLRIVFLRDALVGKFAQAAPGVGIHHLGSSRLSDWVIPFPPLEEQKRIVAEVEARLSALDALRASIERSQRRSKALRAAVLAKAFRGELVPQDPADEPADRLLARIRAERAG